MNIWSEGVEDRYLDSWMEDRLSGYYGDEPDALDPESDWHGQGWDDEVDEEEDE